MYAAMRGVVRLIAFVYLGRLLKVVGLENVPRSGPLLVCANHISTIDPPLVPAKLPRSDSWSMAKSEYFQPGRRFIRWVFTSYHAFPVVRHSADRNALRRAFSILAEGHALVVYPEGTRVDDGRLREPEPGVGFIALRAGVPVLPVGLIGTNECWPKGARFPRRTRVAVVFGKPFTLSTTHADGTRLSRDDAAEAIMVAIARLLPDANRGVFADWESRLNRLAEVYRPVSRGEASPSLPR